MTALLDAVDAGTVKPAGLAEIAESLLAWPTDSIKTRARRLLGNP